MRARLRSAWLLAGLCVAHAVAADAPASVTTAPVGAPEASGPTAGHTGAPVAPVSVSGPVPDPWPEGEGREIARRACHDCHDPIVITASRLSAAQWSARVDAMLAKGAKVSDDEIELLIDYLATHFGPRR